MDLTKEELERKLKARENELKELKSMFQLVIDTIPTSVFWKDKELRFLGANKLFLKDANLDDGESIIGKTDFDISIREEDAEYFRKTDNKIIEQNKPKFNIIEPKNRFDDEISWLETNKVPITNDQGNVVGILGTYQDITSRILHELTIEDSNRKLRIKNNELEQFAYMASHDLQEPLNTILGFSQLLKEFSINQMDDVANTYVDHILTATVRMKDLIKGVLDYSRINAELEATLIKSDEMIEKILSSMDYMIQESQANIIIKELPNFRGYEKIISLLFQNLISNAIKFKKDNQPPVVTISGTKQDRFWQFEIEDNGIGIDKEHRSKIFQIFQRLHGRNEFKGSGIGLSHCKKVIELHNGEIWIKSNKLGGSTFCFTIPFQLS